MHWSTRRRLLYAIGVLVFFGIMLGGPLAYKVLTIPPTCVDGIQNQGETSVDHGGPCPLLDQSNLQPSTTLWSRSFKVRDGSYSAMAYVENPNNQAGARPVRYLFRLYDAENILVAEREGSTFVVPGGTTPVFEAGISTGNRTVAHTFFAFTAAPVWERMMNPAQDIRISDETSANIDSSPRITALLRNTSIAPLSDVTVAVVVFDTAGNAFAASETRIDRLNPNESRQVVFTWPDPFPAAIGQVDIIPFMAPRSVTSTP